MKILLVYPQHPDTFWSFKHALRFISKKAAFPPLGLLTVAAMLPKEWEKSLVDMNTDKLRDEDIEWADYVFLSAMAVQRNSAKEVIKRCNELGTKIVAGGPLFTTGDENYKGIDHFVLNEAEITLPLFVEDLKQGCAKVLYATDQWPDITATPVPAWDLIDIRNYASMSIQYSRGCPFDCEFCDITVLNGRKPRVKRRAQLMAELDALYERGCRSSVFIVDDNFIGNRRRLKEKVLPAIIHWMKEKRYPFTLFTEASINLADEDELIRLMVRANFSAVFIGIETPNEASLVECKKNQNLSRNLLASVKKLQKYLQVQGGFIVGFDNDPCDIFDQQIKFIEKASIVTAMVGILHVLPGTKLYQRLKNENRLREEPTGNNTDCSINFIPRMDEDALMKGYRSIVNNVYSSKNYYGRIRAFLSDYRPEYKRTRPQLAHLKAFARAMWVLGIREKGRKEYWKFLGWVVARRLSRIPEALTLAIWGYHFRKVWEREK